MTESLLFPYHILECDSGFTELTLTCYKTHDALLNGESCHCYSLDIDSDIDSVDLVFFLAALADAYTNVSCATEYLRLGVNFNRVLNDSEYECPAHHGEFVALLVGILKNLMPMWDVLDTINTL